MNDELHTIFDDAMHAKETPALIVKKCTDPAALKILFICSQNIRRSRTAEEMFSAEYNVMSAGLWCGNTPRTKELTHDMVMWADYIFVFEKLHSDEVNKRFRDSIRTKNMINLDIKDRYVRGSPELQSLILQKTARVLRNGL
jgi:predicted protein tyrosine phosphatase